MIQVKKAIKSVLFLFLVLLFTLISCNNSTKSDITPPHKNQTAPEWVIGTWQYEKDTITNYITFTETGFKYGNADSDEEINPFYELDELGDHNNYIGKRSNTEFTVEQHHKKDPTIQGDEDFDLICFYIKKDGNNYKINDNPQMVKNSNLIDSSDMVTCTKVNQN